ncbi:glycosyltransferase [Chloroflexus sp.]|uniref:glycosyltransferase n=1 Tax=Chloroflexus sp. TaxID=1904827 RepID=UPI002ACE04BC|nr:glycosyltransferase [Chloroflexus sp.]
MNRLLIISQDVIGRRMAGPGIRMWEIARVLASYMPVTLIAIKPIDLDPYPNIEFGYYDFTCAGALQPHLERAHTVLANGFVVQVHPELLDFQGKLIIDLYDPIVLESFEIFRHSPIADRERMFARDVESLCQALYRGDHFLCATERQRDLYIGGLLTLGRITPALIDADPLLRNLIDVVPFGVSDAPPQASGQPALRGVLDDLGPNHEIVLWSSGLWDWMDPQTLVKAMPQVLAAVPDARLVFLAGRHPGPVHEMVTPQQTRQLAAELGLLGHGIHFYDEWIPYERRADFLLEAAVMVSLHREHLETRYAAVRSRVLDHLWVGKPTVLSAGDTAAELIVAHGAGETVPIGDVNAVASALIRLLVDRQRRAAQGANAVALGQRLRWSQVVQPLLRMIEMPDSVTRKFVRLTPSVADVQVNANSPMQEEVALMPTYDGVQTSSTLQQVRNDAIKVQEQMWRLNQLPSEHPVWRWLQQKFWLPLMSPQRDYNAAVLRSMYTLAEQMDHTIGLLFDVAARLEQRAQALEQRAQALEQRAQELALRVTNLEDGMQDHNHRQVSEIHQIGQQIRDFADQLAGLEETATQMLAHIGGVPALPPKQE